MDNELDNWENLVDNVKVEREEQEFKLSELKIEHYYFDYDSLDYGNPIKTSIELVSTNNIDTDKLEWKKIISHTYISFDDITKTQTDEYIEDFNNDEIIKQIEKNDLRKLCNNYYTESEDYTHWELTYNDYFKITGTYDREIDEFILIKDLLNFKQIIKEELEKIKNKLK